jgi:pyrroloquinoline quinone (PQQ) biosynthesis protein C
MPSGRELIQKLQMELRPLHEKIVGHRYLAALENGEVSRESLVTFALQQHHIIRSDLRSVALLVSRHGNHRSRSYLLDILQGETSALQRLGAFLQALAIEAKTIDASEPIPAAFAYSAFFAWLALYGSDAEFAAAISINFPAWGINCGRMSSALKARYGFKSEDLTFFDFFAAVPSASDAGLEVIQDGLDRGLAATEIARAARMLQSYELLFWDAMADTAVAP